ncbi:hypothetical protein [Methylomonas rivi]|uniref:Uncharacterized protein n=1 Tax=Methylomonas rivi TaxID=2952226 RepID=A0ABT1TZF3_9GAMM|nr:hypothetical protein [Methylomonas sp. WSC-6]MCQ8126940.1 hypothetical protein [Methylomonas sp. WSC-6]
MLLFPDLAIAKLAARLLTNAARAGILVKELGNFMILKQLSKKQKACQAKEKVCFQGVWAKTL